MYLYKSTPEGQIMRLHPFVQRLKTQKAFITTIECVLQRKHNMYQEK